MGNLYFCFPSWAIPSPTAVSGRAAMRSSRPQPVPWMQDLTELWMESDGCPQDNPHYAVLKEQGIRERTHLDLPESPPASLQSTLSGGSLHGRPPTTFHSSGLCQALQPERLPQDSEHTTFGGDCAQRRTTPAPKNPPAGRAWQCQWSGMFRRRASVHQAPAPKVSSATGARRPRRRSSVSGSGRPWNRHTTIGVEHTMHAATQHSSSS